MDTRPKQARIQPLSNHTELVVMLRSVAVNAFRWLKQKPCQIHYKRTDKVENDLIYNVTGKDAGKGKNHVTNRVLDTDCKGYESAPCVTKNTHNCYSTNRRKKYNCLNESIFTIFSSVLQLSTSYNALHHSTVGRKL